MEALCVLGEVRNIYLCRRKCLKPISVAARSKAWVCDHSLAGTLVSNPTGRMDLRRISLMSLVLSEVCATG
jgi:hypothetical protein